MSNQENKEIVRRYIIDVWDKGNFDAERQLVAGDVVDHNRIAGLPPGLAGHHQLLVTFRNAFPDLRVKLEDLIADEDKVVDRWTAHGTHQGELFGISPTGKSATFMGVDIIRIERRKIAEIWHLEDVMGLMQQLGAIPR